MTTTGPVPNPDMPRSTGEAAAYQRLREYLGYLRLPDAATALPGVLDEARAQSLSPVATVERLLAAEVTAIEARRGDRAHPIRLPARHLHPGRVRLPRPTRRGRSGDPRPRVTAVPQAKPPTCCSSARPE
jgi:hypothetical protein